MLAEVLALQLKATSFKYFWYKGKVPVLN